MIGTTGAACAVGFPLSLLGRAKGDANKDLTSLSTDSQGCESISSNIQNQPVDFGTFWHHLNGQLNKKSLCKELPWKGNLETILKMGNSEDRQYRYIIQQEDYSNCFDNKPCGFLEVQKTGSKKTTRYKLRIAYKMFDNQKYRWEIVVARIVGEGNPSYFNGYSDSGDIEYPRWEVIQDVRWEDLSSWNAMSQEAAWKKIPGYSIISPINSHKDR